MKKRILALLLCGTLAAGLSACTVTDGKDTPPASEPPQQSEASVPSPGTNTEPSTAPAVTPAALESSGSLGDYAAEIKDFVLTKDYTGAPAIVITYTFTNNSEDSTTAMVALVGAAYQNGVELGSAMIINDEVYNAKSSVLDIKPGGSIDVQHAYSLISETAPVEFELGELISFSDEALGKTFEITEGGVTELATIDVPADAVTGQIGDFEVSIISMSKGKDYEGKDCVTVVYGFKNNSDEVKNFSFSCSAKAYQDGVQLESAIVTDQGISEITTSLTKVKPGAAITVSQSYLATSSSDVEVEVSELISFDNKKVSRTFTME